MLISKFIELAEAFKNGFITELEFRDLVEELNTTKLSL